MLQLHVAGAWGKCLYCHGDMTVCQLCQGFPQNHAAFQLSSAWVKFSSFCKRNLSWSVVQKVLKLGSKFPENHKATFCPWVFEADLKKIRSSQFGSLSWVGDSLLLMDLLGAMFKIAKSVGEYAPWTSCLKAWVWLALKYPHWKSMLTTSDSIEMTERQVSA